MNRDGVTTSRGSEGEPGKSVMCVYQDSNAHKWADRACVSVVNGTPIERRSWWKLDDLRHPGVLAGAAYMAMRADFVVVSLSSGGGLPLPFYVWMNSWFPYRKAVGGTLVAVIGGEAQSDGGCERACEFLRQVARQANMRFVVKEQPAERETHRASEPSLASRVRHSLRTACAPQPALAHA